MKILFVLACIGLVISAVLHFTTYFGIDPSEPFPHILLMHIGIFVIWIPCVAILGLLPRDQNGGIQMIGFAPKWMQWVTGVAGVLAIANFAISIVVAMFWGSGAKRNGQYVLRNIHGQVVRQITEGEYHQYNADTIRMFSSFWLIFYSLGMTILASAIAYRKLDQASGLSARGQDDGPRGIPLWVHTLLDFAVVSLGLCTGPIILVATTIVFHLKFGCCATVLFFPSGIARLIVARRFVRP